jgi:hypothetical protein
MFMRIIVVVILFIFSFFFTSCVENVSDANPSTSGLKVTISSPKDSSTISTGSTEVVYSIQGTYSPKFVELYINNSFVKNFTASGSSLPKVFLEIDTSRIGTRINFHIVYFDNNGTSVRSNTIRGVLIQKGARPPFAPYGLNLTKLGDGSALNISWRDSSDSVTNFEIHRKIGFKGTYSLHRTVPGDIRNINDTGLNRDSTYYYKVRAINNAGTSPFSVEVNSDNLFSSGTLEPPTNLLAQARGTRLVILTWKDNSQDENFFAIERKSEWGDFTRIATVLKDVTTFRDTTSGLFAGGTFSYRVKAFSSRDSAHSNVSTTTTYSFDLPAPSNLSGNYDRVQRKVTLNWTNNDNQGLIKSFEIERRVIDSNSFITLGSVSSNVTTYVDSTVQINKVYFYRVVGLNNNRQYSEYSNEIAISTY